MARTTNTPWNQISGENSGLTNAAHTSAMPITSRATWMSRGEDRRRATQVSTPSCQVGAMGVAMTGVSTTGAVLGGAGDV